MRVMSCYLNYSAAFNETPLVSTKAVIFPMNKTFSITCSFHSYSPI